MYSKPNSRKGYIVAALQFLKAFESVCHQQITIKGHEIGEDKVATAALLDHGPAHEPPSSEAVVFKVQHLRR